jgi:hypothetical protein
MKKTSQRQRQKQSVKQVVNVRIGEVKSKKSKRRRAKRQPSGADADFLNYLTPQQMPLVAYQTGYGTFPLSQGSAFTYQPTPQLSQPTPATTFPTSTQPQWEDTGLYGSGGANIILDTPTKKEQQADFIEPVAKGAPDIRGADIGMDDNSSVMSSTNRGVASMISETEPLWEGGYVTKEPPLDYNQFTVPVLVKMYEDRFKRKPSNKKKAYLVDELSN